MKQFKYTVIFLIFNFSGLAIGSWLMNNGPRVDWYLLLNKAPWTPPGWFFGLAWTSIMICFSIYLAKQFILTKQIRFLTTILFVEFILNVSWNYIFFNQRLIFVALIVLVFLTSLLFYYFFKLSDKVANYKYLLLPYMVWLCVAISLNLYILIHN